MARKTIEHAVKNLPKEQAALIKRAWKATGCMDLYDGRLNEYIGVIAQTLETREKRINQLERTLEHIKGVARDNLKNSM